MINFNRSCPQRSYPRAYLAPPAGQYSSDNSTWGPGITQLLHTIPSFMRVLENFQPPAFWWFFAHPWSVSTRAEYSAQETNGPFCRSSELFILFLNPSPSPFLSLPLNLSLPLSLSPPPPSTSPDPSYLLSIPSPLHFLPPFSPRPSPYPLSSLFPLVLCFTNWSPQTWNLSALLQAPKICLGSPALHC